MPQDEYVRQAKLIRVVDGDTVDLAIDLGFGVWVHERFRIDGINTPEKTGSTKDLGLLATSAMTSLFNRCNFIVTVKTRKDKQEKFGRYLAQIIGKDSSGVELNFGDEMIRGGYAVEYHGERRT